MPTCELGLVQLSRSDTGGGPIFVSTSGPIFIVTASLVIANVVQQIFVAVDKRRLLLRVQLGRHRFRLAMLHAQPMQQGDQPRPALIGDAAFGLDPGADLAGRPRQRLGDPGLQLVLLRIAQPAGAAVMTETRQAFDARL